MPSLLAAMMRHPLSVSSLAARLGFSFREATRPSYLAASPGQPGSLPVMYVNQLFRRLCLYCSSRASKPTRPAVFGCSQSSADDDCSSPRIVEPGCAAAYDAAAASASSGSRRSNVALLVRPSTPRATTAKATVASMPTRRTRDESSGGEGLTAARVSPARSAPASANHA